MLTIETLRQRIGEEIAVSDWFEIDQNRVNLFADATDDHQWIHVDVDRARAESPYGAPIAHGFLTLSLLARFSGQLLRAEGVKLRVELRPRPGPIYHTGAGGQPLACAFYPDGNHRR